MQPVQECKTRLQALRTTAVLVMLQSCLPAHLESLGCAWSTLPPLPRFLPGTVAL